MLSLKFLAILLLSTHNVFAGQCPKRSCGQGEGDCDRDSDCLDGLVCDFDWWWGDDYCKAGPNTINYSWSAWGDFGACSVECGADGIQERFRTCNPPSNGGYPCPSQQQSDSQTCNNGPCPVDGGWGDWSDWSECPVSCGGADNTRTRVCDNPAPAHGGADCSGDASEMGRCNENPCPINGGWGEWSSWPECPVSCGGGTQGRTRVCDNPVPDFGGEDCTVDGSTDMETQACNENPCPINGGWGDWSEWDMCPVTCGGADQGRTRACDNPAPQFGGDDCTVDGSLDSETQRCNENPCPIDGGFSDWDEWGPCTAQCGGGDQTRSRRCDNPVPEFGGLDCEGDYTECQRCNMDPCPSTCPA